VTAVHNEIVVDAAAATHTARTAIAATQRAGEKAADATGHAARKTAGKTKDVAAATAARTKEVAATTGEAITDSWITAKVKTKFFDETLLKNSDITVETNDHVVTLRGTVASRTARTRAAAIVRGTEGVTRVINHLVVTP
jgi:hyperosmotically inducible protein